MLKPGTEALKPEMGPPGGICARMVVAPSTTPPGAHVSCPPAVRPTSMCSLWAAATDAMERTPKSMKTDFIAVQPQYPIFGSYMLWAHSGTNWAPTFRIVRTR